MIFKNYSALIMLFWIAGSIKSIMSRISYNGMILKVFEFWKFRYYANFKKCKKSFLKDLYVINI